MNIGDTPNGLPAGTPDVTAAQILAVLTAIAGLLVSFGLLDGERAQALGSAASTIIPVALLLADAVIRRGRAQAVGAALIADHRALALEASPRIDPVTGGLRDDPAEQARLDEDRADLEAEDQVEQAEREAAAELGAGVRPQPPEEL